ncbi:MAG TPA: TraR/DksA C4-type zinc finger protein [Gaiellaceae bacterium]|nr:TraR/DksA C4-type zinc finger protein [Gaiellaceae bacterium]
MTIDTDHFRTLLLKERERAQTAVARLRSEHEGRLDEEVEETAGAADNHLGDLATATLNREIDYTLSENSEQVLGEIDAALRRIDDGTYGTCRVCGKEIAPERLEAYPWASLCIDDARKAENA